MNKNKYNTNDTIQALTDFRDEYNATVTSRRDTLKQTYYHTATRLYILYMKHYNGTKISKQMYIKNKPVLCPVFSANGAGLSKQLGIHKRTFDNHIKRLEAIEVAWRIENHEQLKRREGLFNEELIVLNPKFLVSMEE
jgi:DNA-binding MarR family transcriptional regulator